MGRKPKYPRPEDESLEREDRADSNEPDTVPVRIKKDLHRLFRTVSNWKGVTVSQYLEEISFPRLQTDLKEMNEELDQILKEREEREERR